MVMWLRHPLARGSRGLRQGLGPRQRPRREMLCLDTSLTRILNRWVSNFTLGKGWSLFDEYPGCGSPVGTETH